LTNGVANLPWVYYFSKRLKEENLLPIDVCDDMRRLRILKGRICVHLALKVKWFVVLFFVMGTGCSFNGLMSQGMRSFMVHNRENSLVQDAKVSVNGVSVVYRDGFGFEVPANVLPPFDVEIVRDGYIKLTITASAKLEEAYFLRRKGEAVVCLGSLARPCINYPDHLLVVGRETDAEGTPLDREVVREKMRTLIATEKFEVVREQKLIGMDGTMPFKENMYIVKPAKAWHCESIEKSMEDIAKSNLVEFVGPAIEFVEGGEVISVQPRVDVYCKPEADVAAFEKWLGDEGFVFSGRTITGNMPSYSIGLEAGRLDVYNSQLEKIMSQPSVVEISPRMYSFLH
jgi:hypothetical protein